MEIKKHEAAKLENKRAGFLFLGLVAALAMVLLAFEYTSYDKQVFGQHDLNINYLEEEIIPIARVELPPPPPPKPKPLTIIELAPDDTEPDEPVDFDIPDIDPNDAAPVYTIPEPVEVEEPVHITVETMPVFPGGELALMKHLAEHIKYPIPALDADIQGVVYVSFVVNKNGEVEDVQILKGIGAGCDEEALRVVRALPKWTPGEQRGRKVKVRFNVPVRFTLRK